MNVIFDMDGVISDSEAVYLAGYLHAAELYGLPEDDMRRAVDLATGVTDDQERRIMTETFGRLPQFDMDRTYKACRDYFANVVETGQMQLKPGAKEILQYLKEQEIPVGLASSSPRRMIDKGRDRERGHGRAGEAGSGDLPDMCGADGHFVGRIQGDIRHRGLPQRHPGGF